MAIGSNVRMVFSVTCTSSTPIRCYQFHQPLHLRRVDVIDGFMWRVELGRQPLMLPGALVEFAGGPLQIVGELLHVEAQPFDLLPALLVGAGVRAMAFAAYRLFDLRLFRGVGLDQPRRCSVLVS